MRVNVELPVNEPSAVIWVEGSLGSVAADPFDAKDKKKSMKCEP